MGIMSLLVKTRCIETKHVCMDLMMFPLETGFCWRLNELIRVKWPVGCTVGLGTPGNLISGVIYVAGENIFLLGKGPCECIQGSAFLEVAHFLSRL